MASRDDCIENVPVRSQAGGLRIACKVCGARHRLLRRHLQLAHGLTVREYRQIYGEESPVVSPNYSWMRKRKKVN